jgi:hypothetical protein
MSEHPLNIDVDASTRVSGLLAQPKHPCACLLLAHGAGAGMRHASMTALAEGLMQRDIATLRYQFPYMEQGRRRPDPPPICHATVRAAAEKAALMLPNVPLFAGGRSFGGRMSSQAQAVRPIPKLRGLVLFAFPLHPANKPDVSRAEHLARIEIPLLFLQGSRDALAALPLLKPMVEGLGPLATLRLFEHADHSFHVPAKTGRKDAEVLAEMLEVVRAWITSQQA